MTDGTNIENTICLYPGDGLLKDLQFRNIRLEKPKTAAFLFRPLWDYSGYSSGSGQLQNIKFSEIRQDTNSGISLIEAPSAPNYVNGVNFNNYFIAGNLATNVSTGRLSIGQYVSNLTFSNQGSQIVNITASVPQALRSSGAAGEFTLSRGGSTSQALTVGLNIRGVAASGVEYSALPTSITMPAGSSSAVLRVVPASGSFGDSRTVFLSVASNYNSYMVGPNYHAVVVIRS